MPTGRLLASILLFALACAGCSTAPPPASGPAQAPNAAATSPTGVAASSGDRAAATPAGAPAPAGSPGAASYATPEAAVQAYIAGVAAADVGRILAATAVDQKAAGFRFDLYVDRLKAMLLATSLAPATSPFYIDLNRAQAAAQILGQARNLTYSLLTTEEIGNGTIAPADQARAEAFAKQLDPARLAGLKVEEIRRAGASRQNDPKYTANMVSAAKAFGADEWADLLALVSFEGKDYGVGFSLVRYGTDWRVADQVSNLAGTDSLGIAKPMTRDEYDSLTTGG